jgi:hypothetical protein
MVMAIAAMTRSVHHRHRRYRHQMLHRSVFIYGAPLDGIFYFYFFHLHHARLSRSTIYHVQALIPTN